MASREVDRQGRDAEPPRVDFSVGDIVREAWRTGTANKRATLLCWALFIGMAVLLQAFFGVLSLLSSAEVTFPQIYPGFLDELMLTVVLLPMVGGLWIVGVAFARGNTPRCWSLLYWYEYTLKLLLVSIFVHVLIFVGLVLFILPGIYLAVCLQLAIPLAVDKPIGPLEAVTRSWQIIRRCWFRVLLLDAIAVLALIGSALLAGIPLIWILPTILVGRGILYEKLVGVNTESLRRLSYNPGPPGLRSQPR